MSVDLNPDTLRKATKLTALVKKNDQAKSSSSPWNGLHRLWASANRFRLLTTDGSTFLEWNLLTEGRFDDQFDVTVDAGQFNAVAARLLDVGVARITCSGELLTIHQGQRRLRLQVHPTSNYPGTEQSSDITANQSQNWIYKSEPLRFSLDFVAPFIHAGDGSSSKSVATLRTTGYMIGGNPRRFAQVSGLKPIPSPLSFKQHTAKRVSSFLKEIADDVKIEIEAGRYNFSCPEDGHKLSVKGEANDFMYQLEDLDKKHHESLRIDRKLLDNSLGFLAAVVLAKEKPLALRIRGHEEKSSLQLSTLGQDESAKSTDELAIIRTIHGPRDQTTEEEARQPFAADSHLKINSAPLREVLAEMEENFLDIKYYPKKKLLLITEEVGERIRPLRSVLMTVVRDDSQNEIEAEEAPPVSAEPETAPPLQNVENQEPGHQVQVEDQLPLDSVTPAISATENGTGSRPKGKPQK